VCESILLERIWAFRVLSVLAQFCAHQAQPSGPYKWKSKFSQIDLKYVLVTVTLCLFVRIWVLLDYERVVLSVNSKMYNQHSEAGIWLFEIYLKWSEGRQWQNFLEYLSLVLRKTCFVTSQKPKCPYFYNDLNFAWDPSATKI